jgi:hypothetical protein
VSERLRGGFVCLYLAFIEPQGALLGKQTTG